MLPLMKPCCGPDPSQGFFNEGKLEWLIDWAGTETPWTVLELAMAITNSAIIVVHLAIVAYLLEEGPGPAQFALAHGAYICAAV